MATTETKMRGFALSAPEVRGVLAGTTTLLLRAVKPQPAWLGEPANLPGSDQWHDGCGGPFVRCPLGAVGEQWWVRETWAVARCSTDYETGGETSYYEWTADDGDPRDSLDHNARYGTAATLHYRADGEDGNPTELYPTTRIRDKRAISVASEIKWRPPRTMPQWASRATLVNVAVWVVRLGELTEADALAAGYDGNCPVGSVPAYQRSPRVYHLAQAWEQERRRPAWDDAAWVWAVRVRLDGRPAVPG